MKKTLSLLALMICVIAQPALAQNDAKAQSILDKVNKNFQSLKAIKADFTMKISGNGVDDSRKGTFYMKGNKYRIKMGAQQIMTDTKTMWVYMKDMNEVNVQDYNPDAQTVSPQKIFTGSYQKDYNYTYSGTAKVNGSTCDVITLNAKSNATNINKVKLFINQSNSTIVKSLMYDNSGAVYEYLIKDFTPNPSINDSYFVFDAKEFPGVDVIDLR